MIKEILKNESLELHGRIRLIDIDDDGNESNISEWKENIITDACKVALLRRLKNDTSIANTGIITYGALGIGIVTPAIGDIILGTESKRAVLSISSIAGKVLTLRCYFNKTQYDGTFTEFGWFGEAATAAANTGTMFNHVVIDRTGNGTKGLIVEQQISFI